MHFFVVLFSLETETEKGSSSDDADDTMKDQTPPDTESKALLDELADSRGQPLSSLKPISKVEPLSPLRSPTSPASLMEARAKFFASPPEPVRLDAKLLFGKVLYNYKELRAFITNIFIHKYDIYRNFCFNIYFTNLLM